MRGREMPRIEAIQTFIQFLLSHFGNYFWQTVYNPQGLVSATMTHLLAL
jgi:hypothetical protein